MREKQQRSWMKKFTNKEITNFLNYGYIRGNDENENMPYDLIQIIQLYHDIFYMAGWMKMTIKEISLLEISDRVDIGDYSDNDVEFILGTIVENDNYGGRLKLHFDDYTDEGDEWFDLETGAMSHRAAHRYKYPGLHIGNRVCVKGFCGEFTWESTIWWDGEITALDYYSAQVEVSMDQLILRTSIGCMEMMRISLKCVHWKMR